MPKTKRKDTVMERSERLPLEESAQYVGRGLSKHTLRGWAKQGKVPYFKVGRRLFFSRVDLDELLRRSRVGA
jgi:excisionase family DNA binding protein